MRNDGPSNTWTTVANRESGQGSIRTVHCDDADSLWLVPEICQPNAHIFRLPKQLVRFGKRGHEYIHAAIEVFERQGFDLKIHRPSWLRDETDSRRSTKSGEEQAAEDTSSPRSTTSVELAWPQRSPCDESMLPSVPSAGRRSLAFHRRSERKDIQCGVRQTARSEYDADHAQHFDTGAWRFRTPGAARGFRHWRIMSDRQPHRGKPPPRRIDPAPRRLFVFRDFFATLLQPEFRPIFGSAVIVLTVGTLVFRATRRSGACSIRSTSASSPWLRSAMAI